MNVGVHDTLLVRANEAGLRKILGNLVTNVRTHTPADVPVRLALERADGVGRLWCVADEVPGPAEDGAARIFDRFFRAGSGLGMAVVSTPRRTAPNIRRFIRVPARWPGG